MKKKAGGSNGFHHNGGGVASPKKSGQAAKAKTGVDQAVGPRKPVTKND